MNYIKEEENKGYSNGIPDKAPKRLEQLNKVPSYRRICQAIIKNDFCLKSLGKQKKRSSIYDSYKREELKKRGVINQLEIF